MSPEFKGKSHRISAPRRPTTMKHLTSHPPKNPSRAPRVRDFRVALVHLGCARNLIDSETILGRLGAEGYTLTQAVEDADVAVLNTCSFIGPARQESEKAIEDLLEHKRSGALQRVVVVGCLVEKFREQVERKYPEVDALLALSDYSNVARVVEEVLKGRKVKSGVGGRRFEGQREGPRLLQTPRSYAYLRPSHGCDHSCAFCIIPAIRGRQRSKPLESVVREAEEIVAQGVREIVLVAEDTTGYGTDFGTDGTRLPELVEALAAVQGLDWLRLMYAYPNAFPWRLTRSMRDRPNVVPYLDLPIQHISSRVLRRMRRGGTRQSVLAIIDRLREEVPGITLRTTLLVGHPGEGPEEFAELLEFLHEYRIQRVGAFAFSAETGTPSGADPDRCSAEEAESRLAAVMTLQQDIYQDLQQQRVGTVERVLVDGHEGEEALARSSSDAPEVDGMIRIADPRGRLRTGEFVDVRVQELASLDLRAEVLSISSANAGS